ncbi:MAG: DUF998 domain-containing protein [Promethearchaeota archaeon]|nr:MAG: DUF998 domain-containing protein [Candidatus Lokiarchaeota archaeon]
MNDSNSKGHIFNKIVQPKIVKICIYVSNILFLSGLLIGALIAVFFGPEGYNIIDNYISDLGSFRYTPTPFILDSIAMITAFFLVPIFFYVYKKLISGKKDIIFDSSVPLPKRVFNLFIAINIFIGFICLIIAAIGLFGIGLFSEDRTTELGLHYFFSIVVFAGLATGALFNGIAIFLKKSIYPRLLGLYMMIGPITVALLFVFPPPSTTLPFLEWMMLFAAFLWLIPLSIIILKELRTE